MEVNIIRLIETQPLEKLSEETNNLLISKLEEKFNDEEQKLFLASFWCYQNYKTDEYVIDLDTIWKWLGFSRKDNAKKVVDKKLEKDIEYKILLRQLAEQDQHGGINKEQILLTIDGFKKLCMKSNTNKADKIHNYYIKLEKVIHEIFSEELNEQKELNKKLIKRVKRKIKEKEKIGKCVYIMKDKGDTTHFKFGKASDINHRLTGLNCASVEEHITLHKFWYSRFNFKIEQLVLQAFRNYREANNTELIEINQLEKLEEFVDNLIELLKPYENDLEELEETDEEEQTSRICKICEKNLLFEEFNKSSKINGKQYYKYECKKCEKQIYENKTKTLNKIQCNKCNEYLAYKHFFKDEKKEYMETCNICFKPNHRQCFTCSIILPLEKFSGLLSSCKDCHNKKRRKLKYLISCKHCSKQISEENLIKHYDSILCKKARGLEVSTIYITNKSRSIIQLNHETDEVIAEYKCLTDAHEKTNIGISSIARVCRGKRKTAGGYKWRWKYPK